MSEKENLKQMICGLDLRPAEKVYLWRLMRQVDRYFTAGKKVLDAGCGDGKPAEILTALGCQVTGIDVEAHPERWQALKKKGIECLEASAEKLPFSNASFDAVWIKDSFHHMDNPVQAMAELQRVTRPGGRIVVVEANRYNPVFYVHLTLFGDHQHYTQRGFRKFLRRADPEYVYTLAESRCLPWDMTWILKILEWFEEILENVKIFNPWLTYQIAVVKGKGR